MIPSLGVKLATNPALFDEVLGLDVEDASAS